MEDENLTLRKKRKKLYLKTWGGVVDISIIKKAFEEKAGKVIHKTILYRFLERHNWRKIAPRRYHPQGSQELQENLKKTSLEF